MAVRGWTAGPLTYLASDGQGSVSAALDSSGNVTFQQLYTPYGNVRYSNGASPTASSYTGQRADSATGLDYYHARYDDPMAQQFVSADSVNAGLNRYGYVGGNPTTMIDPSGHRYACPENDCGGAPPPPTTPPAGCRVTGDCPPTPTKPTKPGGCGGCALAGAPATTSACDENCLGTLWWDLEDLKNSIDFIGSPWGAVLAWAEGLMGLYVGLKNLAGWFSPALTVLGTALTAIALNESLIAYIVQQVSDLQGIVGQDEQNDTTRPFTWSQVTDVVRTMKLMLAASLAVNVVLFVGGALGTAVGLLNPEGAALGLTTFGLTLGAGVNVVADINALTAINDMESKISATLCPSCT